MCSDIIYFYGYMLLVTLKRLLYNHVYTLCYAIFILILYELKPIRGVKYF